MRRRIWLDEKQRLRLRLMLVLAIVLTTLLIFDIKMRPVVNTFSEYQAKSLAAHIINDAVVDELEKNRVRYEDLVSTTTGADGNIFSMETNAMTVNVLKARLTTSILQRLSDVNDTEIKVHVGTLLGSQVLVGRGPSVPFRIAPASEVGTQLTHSFESAGINQTRHRIMLEIDVAVTAMLAGHTSRVEVPCSFVIVDTIIIGKVPESFTEVNDDDSSLISKINDYANR